MDKDAIISDLTCRDDKTACALMMDIERESLSSDMYYFMFDSFLALVSSAKSYERVRGFRLCCAQARWDADGRLEASLPVLLALLGDPKPTVVRQCLASLGHVVQCKPGLASAIASAVKAMDSCSYKDSMRPLIEKDRQKLLETCR